MTPFEKTRLHEIASQTLKVWIEQQILETAEPSTETTCEDAVKCVVDRAIDWRRDYIAALTLSRDFKSLTEYDVAISNLQKTIRTKEARNSQNIKDAAAATNAEDFNDAAYALLSSITLSAQSIFLERIRRVFIYLHGEMSNLDDFKHIVPRPETMTGKLFTILQGQGTLDEWKALIGQLPSNRNSAYKQHLSQ